MPAPTITRDEVARRIFGVFQTYGYEGATLARISAATGLGRASLYHYFPGGKDDMARDVLATARRFIAERIVGALDGPGSPQVRVRAMLASVREAYADGEASCMINLMGIGDAGGAFARELRDVAELWVDALARLVRSGGTAPARARRVATDAVVRIEGSLVVARALGDASVFAKTLTDVERLLLDQTETRATN